MALRTPYSGSGTLQPLTNPLAGYKFDAQPQRPPQIGNNDSFSPYLQFKSANSIGIDPQAANAASSFLSSYKAGQPTESLSVGKVANLPAEYYQKQLEDLSRPITQQYEKSRAMARGDQAARGTLYDSQGYKDMGDLDNNFLEQLGSMTRGVQLERMKADQTNEQNYIDRLLGEGNAKRSADLQAKGLDVNMINNLLGYGADRFKSEAGLFSDIYGADTEYNKAVLDYNQPKQSDLLDLQGRLLEMQGYQGVPQEQMWEELARRLGFQGLVEKQQDQREEDQRRNSQAKGQPYYVNGKGWTIDGYKFYASPSSIK